MRSIALALGIAAAAGCTPGEQPVVQVPVSGEIAEFSTYVQPVLEAGCATLDCHGDAGRILRLYARDGLRLAAALRGEDASDAELMANMRAIDGLRVAGAKIEEQLLLLKPLSLAAGGIHHVGGELWIDQNDPAYRCLHAWLRAGASDEAGQTICESAIP